MTQEEAVILATRALFAFATNVRRPPTWIGTPEDIDEALGLLLPALMAPGSAGLRTEITGCASAGPEPGDPRQLPLPETTGAKPPRAVAVVPLNGKRKRKARAPSTRE